MSTRTSPVQLERFHWKAEDGFISSVHCKVNPNPSGLFLQQVGGATAGGKMHLAGKSQPWWEACFHFLLPLCLPVLPQLHHRLLSGSHVFGFFSFLWFFGFFRFFLVLRVFWVHRIFKHLHLFWQLVEEKVDSKTLPLSIPAPGDLLSDLFNFLPVTTLFH